MPEPWTTSASASIGADGIVTLVEGSAFCISSRSGEIDPARPQGLFFRDTRFISELRLHAERRHARTAGGDRARPVQRRVRAARASVARAMPTRISCCSVAATSGAGCAKTSRSRTTARRPRSARSSSLIDADFADLFEVKEGRVSKQGELGCRQRGLAAHVPVQAALLPTRDARRLQRVAAHLGHRTSCTRWSFRRAGAGRRASR